MIGAQDRLELSAEDELWKAATVTGKSNDYLAYLREYPEGRYAAIAKSHLGNSAIAEQGPNGTAGMSASTQNASAHSSAAPEFPNHDIAAPSPERTIRFGDQTMTGNFSADPQTGKVSGTGRIVWTNGNRFEGTLNRGVKEGKGQFRWSSGQLYIGDWANDLPNGKGTIYFANGDRYEGDVRDGQAHGQGIARFKGGDSYAGGWVGGKRHGTGRYSWAQGGYWEGEFRNGERTENGTLMSAQSVPGSAAISAPQPALGNGRSTERKAAGTFP